MNDLQNVIVRSAVIKLKNKGFEGVNKENIFTDELFSQEFRNTLVESLEAEYKNTINELLVKLDTK